MNSFLETEEEQQLEDDEYLFVEPPFSRENPLHSRLHDFENTLRCNICREFFEVPVSLLPCLHTFCSACIRHFHQTIKKGMKKNPDCPECREKLSPDLSKCLVPNHTVATLVLQYKALRGDLSDSLARVTTSNNSGSEEEEEAAATVTTEEDIIVQEPAKRRRTTRSSDVSSATTSAKPAPLQVQQQRLKHKSTTHYTALKHKDLVKLCGAANLSTKGTDRELKARHEEYVRLYNAQCDSFHPMSEAQIVRQVMEREEKIKKESKKTTAHSAALEQLKENRKAMGTDETSHGTALSGVPSLDAEMKANFASMIPKEMIEKRKNIKWKETEEEPNADANMTEADVEQQPVASTSAVAGVASMPTNSTGTTTTSTTTQPPVSKVAAMPVNPYSSAKKKSTNAKVSSVPYSENKPSNANTASAPPTSSARKPAPANRLTNFFTSTPAPRKLSLSQQSAPSSTTTTSQIGHWTCQVCTFENKNNRWSRAPCEMCQTRRPVPDDASQQQPSSQESNTSVILLDV